MHARCCALEIDLAFVSAPTLSAPPERECHKICAAHPLHTWCMQLGLCLAIPQSGRRSERSLETPFHRRQTSSFPSRMQLLVRHALRDRGSSPVEERALDGFLWCQRGRQVTPLFLPPSTLEASVTFVGEHFRDEAFLEFPVTRRDKKAANRLWDSAARAAHPDAPRDSLCWCCERSGARSVSRKKPIPPIHSL